MIDATHKLPVTRQAELLELSRSNVYYLPRSVSDADLVLIDKRRPAPNEVEVMNIVGEVKGRNVLIVDDLLSIHEMLEAVIQPTGFVTSFATDGEKAFARYKKEKFDLVFFSNTQFITFTLGFLWKRLYGVPYVIDVQDPWRTDYYERPGSRKPPGGWKYQFARLLAWVFERPSFAGASAEGESADA